MSARIDKKVRRNVNRLYRGVQRDAVNQINAMSKKPLADRLRICWRILRGQQVVWPTTEIRSKKP